MKEITVLSGKGGTGKTTITAALAAIAKGAVYCDSDVDAADLHLLFHPEIEKEYIYQGAWIMNLNEQKCSQCGICSNNCRFDAIHQNENGSFYINPFQCEGCRLCERVCPEKAISSSRSSNNKWFVSKTRFGTLVHEKMGAGEENSGKLVTIVRNKTKEIAVEQNLNYIINDGPPGIGCATIASLTGTSVVLIIIEPTKSGLHDAKRLIGLIRNFDLPSFAIINKSDIHEDMTNQIEAYLNKEKIPVLGKIPFDKAFVEAMIQGKTIVEYDSDSSLSQQLTKFWEILATD